METTSTYEYVAIWTLKNGKVKRSDGVGRSLSLWNACYAASQALDKGLPVTIERRQRTITTSDFETVDLYDTLALPRIDAPNPPTHLTHEESFDG